MTVTVAPQEFRFVHFDAAQTARIADDVARLVGIDRPVLVEIDETTPLSRVRIDLGDSIVLHVESGALMRTRTTSFPTRMHCATPTHSTICGCRSSSTASAARLRT